MNRNKENFESEYYGISGITNSSLGTSSSSKLEDIQLADNVSLHIVVVRV